MKSKQPKKKISALDKYLIYCIVFFTIYAAAELIVSSITGVTHDTLTNAVKFFCGGEVFLCAMIKRHKLKNETAKSDPEEANDKGGMAHYDD